MKIVFYRLTHGIWSKLMANLYNLDVSTIQKYIDIMCEILVDKDKFYKINIHLPTWQPTWQRLLSIIEIFKDLIGINITIALGDFYKCKCSFKMFTTQIRFFGMYV